MHIFGDHCGLGFKIPFETNILFDKSKLKELDEPEPAINTTVIKKRKINWGE